MITAATMFSGIGAPEVAMPHWRWTWCAETGNFPSAIMAARHPLSVNLRDVCAYDFTERAQCIATPDVIVFGSPCQSFSLAGKRLGMDDPRGNMALIALGIIDRLKPGWFVFENVPGLLSSAEGRDFGILLRAVDELGYSLAWTVLDAQYFGVAQRRKRLFAVGHIGDWRGPAAVLFEPESLCGDHPPRRETGEGVAVCPTLCTGSNSKGGARRPGTDVDTSDSLIVAHALRADNFDAGEDGTGRGIPIVPPSRREAGQRPAATIAARTRSGGGFGTDFDFDCDGGLIAFSCKDHGADAMLDLSPTLRAGTHDKSHANAGVPPAVTVALRGRDGGATAEIGGEQATALRASQGGGDKPYVLTSAVRRLMPRECERLQGFPDDYTAITYRGKPAADGPRYKVLGNSMAVPVMRWILQRIELLS